MRMPWPAALAGAALIALGGAGLIRSAQPLPHPGVDNVPAALSDGGQLTVTGAWVRQPTVPVREAAAYFTVRNGTAGPDRLLSITTGVGRQAVLHSASMRMMDSVTIPAHGELVLSTGHLHVMIEKIIGTLRVGQTVTMDLTFQRAGDIQVNAPVIALGAPPPTAAPNGGAGS